MGSEGILSSELVKALQAGSAHRAPMHRLGLPGPGHFCAWAQGHSRIPAVLSLDATPERTGPPHTQGELGNVHQHHEEITEPPS